jgi:hypothetical protein
MIDGVVNDYILQVGAHTKAVKNSYDLTITGEKGVYPLDEEFMNIERVRYDVLDTTDQARFGYDLVERNPVETPANSADTTQQASQVNPELHVEISPEYTFIEYGTPIEYWLEQKESCYASITLWPFPADSHTGKVMRVWATKYPEALVNDADLPEFRKLFDICIEFGSTMHLGNIGKGIPNRSFYEKQYYSQLSRLDAMVKEENPNIDFVSKYKETWD